VTDTWAPDWVCTPFQSEEMVWPEGNAKDSVQPSIGSPRFLMSTLAPKPPCHWLVTV
jgi:hypothetical protein